MQSSSTDRLNEVIKALRYVTNEVSEGMPERTDVGELLQNTIGEIGSILEED